MSVGTSFISVVLSVLHSLPSGTGGGKLAAAACMVPPSSGTLRYRLAKQGDVRITQVDLRCRDLLDQATPQKYSNV